MNSFNPEQVFYTALSETFEGLIFEEVVLESVTAADLSVYHEECWWVKIELFEPLHCEIMLIVRKDLMVQYTEAIFGMLEDEMPSEPQVLDNLGELMNTVCGRIMALVLPPQTKFRLGLPELGSGKLPDLEGKFRSVNCLIGDNLIVLLVPEKFWGDEFQNPKKVTS